MKRFVAVPALIILFALAGPMVAFGQEKPTQPPTKITPSGPAVINTRQGGSVGWYLIDGNGRALYTFSGDLRGTKKRPAISHCIEACTSARPPMRVSGPPKTMGKAKASLVSTITRPDGIKQATYGGMPLYTFVGDSGKGQTTGGNVLEFGGTWHLAVAFPDKLPPASRKDSFASLFSGVKLNNPECIRYDASNKRYLISNVSGGFQQRDDDGFITMVTAKGASRKWIVAKQNGVTLDAPAGMEIHGGKLYVADINHLRIFDLTTGNPVGSVKVDHAKFLNDLAIADDGTVYITDTGTPNDPGAIFKITPDRHVSAIAIGPKMHRPNGIAFDAHGNLVVVTFASNRVMTMTTGGKIVKTKTLEVGKLDGVVARKDGSLFVSSWKGKSVIEIDPDGSMRTILTNVPQPACFTIDEAHSSLLVPQVRANTIAVAKLPKPQQKPQQPKKPEAQQPPPAQKKP